MGGRERELGKAKLVCRIMAGDPKRGAVSFETEEEIKKGDKVIVRFLSLSFFALSFEGARADAEDASSSYIDLKLQLKRMGSS